MLLNRWPRISVQGLSSGLPLPLPFCLPSETRLWMEARWLLAELWGALSGKENRTVYLDISVSSYPEIPFITMKRS